MAAIFISIMLATLCIQIPNIWAIEYFKIHSDISGAIKIAAYTLPAGFLATTGYVYFYGKGAMLISYPVLVIIAYGVSLITACLLQVIIFRNFEFSPPELLGASFILIGLAITSFSKI